MSTGFDKEGADKDLPDEQQLEEYLRGGSAVSQQYRQLRSADVPTELDRLVLRQAEDAVKPRPAKSRTWMRWAGPLALAASAVLVVSIVIESGVHKETYLSVPASAPVDLPKQEAAEQPREADDARDKAAASNAAAGVAADANVVNVVPVAPPQSEVMLDAAPPAEIAPAAPVAPQFVSPPPPSADVEVPPAQSAHEEEVEVMAKRATAQPVPAPAPAPVYARARQLEAEDALQEAVVTAQRRSERKQTAGPRNTVAAPTAAGAASTADVQQSEPRNYSDPEQWLRDIRQLRKENKHEEADREWLRFRYVFPNYEVANTDPARGAAR